MAGKGFASYASHLLSSQAQALPPPLFYSTRDSFLPFEADDDILGPSVESNGDRPTGRSFGGSTTSEGEDEPPPTASVLSAAVPAFMSRLSQAPARFSRGWRAHESVLPVSHYYSDDESDEEEFEHESPPGAFLSTPLHGHPTHSTIEPLLAPRTLFVYPLAGQATSGGVRAHAEYRDAHWIVIYGLSVIFVIGLGVIEWWKTPARPPTPPIPGSSIFNAVPILLILSLVSLFAGASSATYLLAVRHSMRHLIHAALLGGPLVFVGCGVVAFAGSFSGSGVASDSGWKAGLRWFALGCFVMGYLLARSAISRRKQVARAIALGELATQTILEHPPLVLLCLILSVVSTVIAVPFLLLLAGLLFDSASSASSLANRGSILTLMVYMWTLSILRGIQHAVVGGVVGSHYFERADASYPGSIQVVRAALQRATHQSLGTIIFASAITAAATTLTMLLKSAKKALRSKHLHPLLQPLTYLVPLFSLVTGAIAVFNSYALSYAGMTGDTYTASGREVVKMLRSNETGRLGDSLLVRLVLFVTSVAWGILAGLVAFLIASSRLQSGGLAPIVALLCFFVPLWTMKLSCDVCGDAVDSLFICMNLDLGKASPSEGELPRKTAEAFGIEEEDGLM